MRLSDISVNRPTFQTNTFAVFIGDKTENTSTDVGEVGASAGPAEGIAKQTATTRGVASKYSRSRSN